MKNRLLWLLLGLMVAEIPLKAKDTLFLGPKNLRVSDSGEFSRVEEKKPVDTPIDNLWAYRLYPQEKKLTGHGVTVAVADSGISPHAEFNGKNIQGQDFTLSPSIADAKNHGTGVTGIIGARGIQFSGVAPQARIIVYKIDDGSRLIGPQAAAAAVNTVLAHNEEHPDQKISVLNLSYGVSGGGSVALTQALRRAYETGVVVVCPAGNVGFPGVYYPANQSSTLAVGAMAKDGKHIYGSSSFGKELDFVAPGDHIYTTDADGGYVLMSGTSVAAGFVSASAALAIEGLTKKLGRYPTVPEVKQSLIQAAVQLPGVQREKQGYGFIDVSRLESQFK